MQHRRPTKACLPACQLEVPPNQLLPLLNLRSPGLSTVPGRNAVFPSLLHRPQLQWPRSGFDATRRMAANAALLQGWMLGMSPATCAATSKRSMLLDVLPALMHIAAPALRPVSQHLYSSCEQEAVRWVLSMVWQGVQLLLCVRCALACACCCCRTPA